MITIEKWSGLITNASPYALPGGAAVTQVNLQCLQPGQIEGRPGLTNVASWTGTSPGVSAVVICGGSERVLIQAGTALHVIAIT